MVLNTALASQWSASKHPFPESKSTLSEVKNIIRTFEPKNFEKLRTAQPEPKFTGSYKKKACIRISKLN